MTMGESGKLQIV